MAGCAVATCAVPYLSKFEQSLFSMHVIRIEVSGRHAFRRKMLSRKRDFVFSISVNGLCYHYFKISSALFSLLAMFNVVLFLSVVVRFKGVAC